MSLLIRNGELVTASGRRRGDLLCRNGKIARIGSGLSAPAGSEEIDATGKFVFPGFVDPHVHIHLPFMGTLAKDDYGTGSRAALIGGTTTFFDMCLPTRDEDPAGALATWNARAQGRSACDWSYHVGVSRCDDAIEEQLRGIVASGLRSFKVFLAYKGAFAIDEADLFRVLRLARELDVVVCAHCENAELVAARQSALLAEGRTGPEWHHESRPPFVEALGVTQFCAFLEATGARGYIVHLSSREALDAAERARARGVAVSIETLATYLVCDRSFAERGGFEGAKWVMSPPIRSREDQEALWSALSDGRIDTIGTDHAPFDFHGQKEMGREDFTKIPNGVPAIEDRVNLVYTYGVKRNRITLEQMVDLCSTRPAKEFGLYPRKGSLEEGADADIVVYDPEYRGVISAAAQSMNVDYSGFEGVAIEGRPSVVTVRGQVQVRDGVFVGDPEMGRFLRR